MTAKTFCPLKVTFHLDSTGVAYDPFEPTVLDALIMWAVCPFLTNDTQKYLTRDDEPEEIPLPLKVWHIAGQWGFHASALFPPDGTEAIETVRMWRKKFRTAYSDMIAKGLPSLTGGPYREHNMPLPLLLTPALVGWCNGDRRKVKHALNHIKYIGKHRGSGIGKVVGLEVERTDDDWALVRDGKAMRHLPKADSLRQVRSRPPYWNSVGRVPVCEIGEDYEL